jgi:ABC-type phosphate/phosphonate transport system substrate-binding protein
MIDKLEKRMVFLSVVLILLFLSAPRPVVAQEMTLWFVPGFDPAKAIVISENLSQSSGVRLRVKVALNYPELFAGLSLKQEALVYAGSFAAVLLKERNLAVPLVQKIDGKESYAGVMVYPKGENPTNLLRDFPKEIAYAVGASSGESCAKAATGGLAAVGVREHSIALAAVKVGKAKAAMVKNLWWESNKKNYPDYEMYEVPEISQLRNPDNILMASSAVSEAARAAFTKAAIASAKAFNANEMKPFNVKDLDFSLALMRKGGIDPVTYAWPTGL